MKVSITSYLFLLITAGTVFASGSGPIITESDEKIVVEYTGTPQEPHREKPVSAAVTKKLEELRQLQEEGRILQEQLRAKYLSDPAPTQTTRKSDDVRVCCISAMEVERSYNYVTYSIKADVDNKGEKGEVFVKLIAKNRDGHQIDYVYLRTVLDRRESRTLTTTTMMTYQQAMDARIWEVASISKN